MTPAKQKLNNLVQPAAAAELARLLDGQLAGTDAASITIASVAALHEAGPQDLSFCENMSFAAALAASQAGLVVVPQGMQLDDDRPRIIIAGSPRAAIAKLLASTQKSMSPEPGIHPSAVVDRTADVAADATIGPGAVVGANAQVHAGAIMRARSVLADNCILGERSVLLEGAVVGADGFGFVGQGKQRVRFPHVGRAVIGPDVEIGANSCVDRGALGDTIVGARTKVDNLVQIGHNVRIDSDSIICGCAAIGGSAVIGSNCVIGGAASVNGHVELADGVQVMSMTLVMQSVSEKNQVIGGSLPAMPQKRLHKLWRRLLRITQGISK